MLFYSYAELVVGLIAVFSLLQKYFQLSSIKCILPCL